jgi:hypothetical protein
MSEETKTPETGEKIDTFEAIRRARLEKIQLDVKMRKIKLSEAEMEQDLNSGAVIPTEDIIRAINGLFSDLPEGRKCGKCYDDMERRLR